MVFSSLLFLFRFIPVFFTVYYLVPGRLKNFVLLAGSLFFYAWGEPVYVVLLLISTLSDYFHGRGIAAARAAGRNGLSRGLLSSSLSVNLFMLGFFKYAGLLADLVNRLTGMALAAPELPLPVGISFYTFQTMSYCIDIYRGKVPPQKDLTVFGTYVAMFPQLVAGPIVRYETVADALYARRVTADDVREGLKRFLAGLGKKVLLANQAGAVWEEIAGWDYGNLTQLAAFCGILFFTFQIYFDFSGYSDMAVGLGRLLGFSFPENFRYPYMADSVTDFWRRWHITLGAWFKEYVYIPLGGSKKGVPRQMFNLTVVWMLTGLWHGAAVNFLAWGLWFAFFLSLEKLLRQAAKRNRPVLEMGGLLFHSMRRIYTMLVVLGGWVLFALPQPGAPAAWFAAMLSLNGAGLWNADILYVLSGNLVLLALLCLGCTPVPARFFRLLLSRARHDGAARLAEAVLLAGVFVLSMAFLVSESYNPFLYFRF